MELWILNSPATMILLSGYDSKILLIESERQSILLKVESFVKLGLLYTKQKCAKCAWALNFNHKAVVFKLERLAIFVLHRI